MYYEEKWINGNLMWRGTPNGEWKEVSRSELLTRLKKAESERWCEWVHVVPDGIPTWWESSCGLNGEGPNYAWRFCPECGGKIVKSEEVNE